jgi:hypothetical protein
MYSHWSGTWGLRDPGPRQVKMDTKSSNGFALPAAVFALVVVGVLVTGGFYLARQEGRIGLAATRGTAAFYLAEQGAMEVLTDWSAGTFGSLPQWGTAAVAGSTGDGTWSVDVTRMTDRLYYLHSTGFVRDGEAVLGQASRSVGYVVRRHSAEIPTRAALMTRGETEVRGTAEVHGEDMYPPGWGNVCNNPLVNMPGILTNDTSDVATKGQGEVTGEPPVVGDPDLSEDDFRQFGDMSWEDLIDLADIRLGSGGEININNTGPDSTAAGVCRKGQSYPLNWGNPLNPAGACGDWFPIIYVNGTARIQSGGIGQGILLVEGDLDLRGNFIFNGLVIVQGSFETQGSGNRVNGGVMASNANFEDQLLVGGSVVQYSQCAVLRAVENAGQLNRVRPIDRRGWVDVSSVSGG